MDGIFAQVVLGLLLMLSLSSSVYALSVPSEPYLELYVLSGNSLQANFTPPTFDNGASITSYKVDYDTDPGVQEVQEITTSTYIGSNEVQTITTSTLDIDEQQLVSMTATAVNEVQSIEVVDATGGYFFIELDTTSNGGSLQYSGYIYTTYPAEWDGTGTNDGANVQDIISNMPNIASSNEVVNVTLSNTGDDYKYLITFPESMGNVPLISVHTTQLTGPSAGQASATVCPSGNSDCVEGNVVSGTFRLTYEGQTTADIDYDATEAELREALELLSTIGSVAVTRDSVDNQGCYKWTV
jgi:hypothetical protein